MTRCVGICRVCRTEIVQAQGRFSDGERQIHEGCMWDYIFLDAGLDCTAQALGFARLTEEDDNDGEEF